MEGTLGEKFTTPSSWGSVPSMQSEFDLINSTDISSQNFRFNPQRIHQLSDELIYHIPKESSEKDFPSSFEDMIHNRRNGVMKSIVSLEERCSRERCETRQTNMARKFWLEEKRRYVTKQDEITKLGVSMVANKVNNLVQNDAWKGKVKKNLLDDHVNVMTKSKKDGSAILEFLQLPLDSPNYVAAWRILHILWQREAKTPMERLMATMSHLGRQFQSHVFKRVRIAMAHGQITEERKYSGISSAIAAYVYLTLGKEASYWAIIFYLLRIGDFASAKSVLVYNQANHRLLDILDAYSQHQGSLSSVWDQNSFISIHPVRKDLIGNDEFENYCIFLLSGNKEAERSFKISTTTEDFMYFSLLRVSIVPSNTVKSLIELGKEIKTLGPKYFESNNETNAWSYAMPLFLAQQYRSSILHLIKVGGDVGALEATHLGIFLPELCDLGESSSSCLLSSLLIDFARNLKPSQALAYLIHLPDNKEKRKRITELLVVSRQFEELAGTIDTNGIRREEDSALARYFCKQEISQILEEAAIVATDIGNEKDSLELLNLAENYTSLINILNEKLSSLLLAGTHSEKDFWLKACQDFDQWHFRGRRTLALEVIEAKNCLNLVNVFQILLKLFDFFDQFAIHEFKDALRIVESLDLIPKTKEETESKCNAFRISNQALKNIFPAVLEAYMDSLFQQYIHTINHDTNSDVLERNKQELKAKALLVTSFAARLQLPVQSRSRMSLVQAQII